MILPKVNIYIYIHIVTNLAKHSHHGDGGVGSPRNDEAHDGHRGGLGQLHLQLPLLLLLVGRHLAPLVHLVEGRARDAEDAGVAEADRGDGDCRGGIFIFYFFMLVTWVYT